MTMEKWGDDPFSWTRHIVKIASFLQADESQAGIKIAGETSITPDMQIIPSYGRKQRGTKEPLMKVKEESEKAGLKLSIQKTKIMASSPITSWQTEGGKCEN